MLLLFITLTSFPPSFTLPPHCLLPLLFTLPSHYFVLSIPSLSSPVVHGSPILTVALSSSAGRQGNGMLHGSAQARVSTVTVAESGSVDVELGVLGGEG